MARKLKLTPEGKKICSLCFAAKPLSEFYPHSSQNGYRSACRTCCVKVVQRYKVKNPFYELAYRLKRKFGLSIDEYFKILDKQDDDRDTLLSMVQYLDNHEKEYQTRG